LGEDLFLERTKIIISIIKLWKILIYLWNGCIFVWFLLDFLRVKTGNSKYYQISPQTKSTIKEPLKEKTKNQKENYSTN